MKRLLHILAGLGPGIFAVGYTVGTGSVTSMAKAGAESGFGYLWVLALSCIFSFALMTAYGRYAAVTGETSLHGMARQLPCGRLVAALVFIGVVIPEICRQTSLGNQNSLKNLDKMDGRFLQVEGVLEFGGYGVQTIEIISREIENTARQELSSELLNSRTPELQIKKNKFSFCISLAYS